MVVNSSKTAMTPPTTKLVSDMVAMQVCYVNTTRPDFLNEHKVRLFPLSLFVIYSFFKVMALATRQPECEQACNARTQTRKVDSRAVE